MIQPIKNKNNTEIKITMETKQYLPHQQRVVEELEELSDKVQKLSVFITGEIFSKLSEDEKKDLVEQLETMETYADILERRINRF